MKRQRPPGTQDLLRVPWDGDEARGRAGAREAEPAEGRACAEDLAWEEEGAVAGVGKGEGKDFLGFRASGLWPGLSFYGAEYLPNQLMEVIGFGQVIEGPGFQTIMCGFLGTVPGQHDHGHLRIHDF